MENVLIAWDDRGIGLAIRAAHFEKGWHVFVTCRKPEATEHLCRLQTKHGEPPRRTVLAKACPVGPAW